MANTSCRISLVYNLIKILASEMADPAQNIPIHKKKDDGGVAQAGETGRNLVAKISENVLKQVGYNHRAADDEPDPKDYKLEADEVNELFRATSSQRGGLGLQLCIFITIVLFILVDTVSVSSAQGTMQAMKFLTEDAYWDYKHNVLNNTGVNDQDEMIFTTSKSLNDEVKQELRDFYTNSHVKFRDPKIAQLDDEYVFGLERAGQVLRYITDVEEFYEWLGFVLRGVWGPKEIGNDSLLHADKLNEQVKAVMSSKEMCPEIPDELKSVLTYDKPGLFDMDANYIMGARLAVRNAKIQDIIGNSPFKAIYKTTRTHTDSVVKIGKKVDHHVHSEFFEDHSEEDGNQGHAGEYIAFFNGGNDCEVIQQLYDYVVEHKVVSHELLHMELEFMTFSAHSHQGTIIKYNFFQNNAGLLQAYLTLFPFQPENNGYQTNETWLRVSLEFSYFVCMVWVLFESIANVRKKCRQLFSYRLNEFTLHDIVQYILLLLGIVILVKGGILLYSPRFNFQDNFRLPLVSYEEYMIWHDASILMSDFRGFFGSFIMMQMINLLLTASVILPSLGILFKTIERSINDMFVFTMITLSIFIVFVIAVYVSFGEQIYQFHSLAEAFLSCFEMFLGDFYYGRMYKADPKIAAIILFFFCTVMNFMVMNMYTAIVIRTYHKLQARQLFLGESMARIQGKKAKKKLKNCLNLLRCRSNQKKQRDDGQRRNELDDEDKGSNQKLSQIFSQNLAKVWRVKVVTKEKFTRELNKAAYDVTKDKLIQKNERLKLIQNMNAEHQYTKLKRGIILLIHLVIATNFYHFWHEAEVHADIQQALNDYINHSFYERHQSFDDLQSSYQVPMMALQNIDMQQIGSSIALQDTLRLTYRLYAQQENKLPQTKDVFPQVRQQKFDLHSQAATVQTTVFSIMKMVLNRLKGLKSEKTDSFSTDFIDLKQYNDYRVKYKTPQTGSFESFYDEGGFVFEFDTSDEKILKLTKDSDSPITLEEFTKLTAEKLRTEIALIGVDWAMYNPNQDVFIYVGILFKFMPDGDLIPKLAIESFKAKPSQTQLIMLGIFTFFYLYYLFKLLVALAQTFKERKRQRDIANGVFQDRRLNDENERPWYLRLVNFIGIDDQRLQGQNLLVVLVLVIWMILKKIVLTVWYLLQAIYFYCSAELLNFIEFLNTVLLTIILIGFIQFLPVLLSEADLSEDNPKLMQTIMQTAVQSSSINTWMAYSIFCMCIRVLQLPSFSLMANMPFETLNQGKKDILNILIILFIFIVSSSLACYIVFCSQLEEFSHFIKAMYATAKIYMGDFTIIGKMYSSSPNFTTFYLFMSMIMYTMFISQMLLGVIVGHFMTEWKRVHQIVRDSPGKSFTILPVIWRVIYEYFTQRRDKELKALLLMGINPDDPRNRKCCPCNCTCKSLNPSGMIERIIIYFMMNCCRKKKSAQSKAQDDINNFGGDGEFSDEDDGFNNQQSVNNKKSNQVETVLKARMPYDKDDETWGMPNQLKLVEDFCQHTGARTYMKWFDGWSIEQYKTDWDKFDYFDLKKKLKKGDGNIDQRMPDGVMAEMKKFLPQNLESVLNLDFQWNDVVDESEKANSNYWFFHLAKQVKMLTKREIELGGLKAMDSFFTQHLVTKAQEQSTSLQDQLSPDQIEIFFMNTAKRDEFFSNPDHNCDEKYLAWKAIDMVHRYNLQQAVFETAGKEKDAKKEANSNKDGHANLMSLLITQMERPIEESDEAKLFNNSIISQIASDDPKQGNQGKNPLKFQAIKAATWRKKKYHRVYHYLQKVWRELLTDRERYELWFNYFNTMERVRLWNQLVFTREWFRRVVSFSRKQTRYKEALINVERILKKNSQKKPEAQVKEDDENVEMVGATKKDDKLNNFYRGFHRRDINEMLKEYARKMYQKGVRDEELTIIQIQPEQDKDIIDRQHIGDTTSFFNNDLQGETKKKSDLMQKISRLDRSQEMREVRRIFTPDQMLKVWQQFLSGTFMLLQKDKVRQDMDIEDGVANEENKVLRLEDEEKYMTLKDKTKMKDLDFRSYWEMQKQYQEKRTMDRYEQIHFFFSSMIEHNIKTLESCQEVIRHLNDKTDAEPELKKSILKNNESQLLEESKSDKKNSSKKDAAEESKKEQEPSNEAQEKFALYESVRKLVIDEEERLPLWMLMSKEEKLDMLAHQCIDSEAQIMGMLIEFEYGAENNFKKEGTNLSVDTMLERALDQVIFQKYLAYTRLQATFYARQFTRETIEQTQDQSIKLYTYAEYLYDLDRKLRRRESDNNSQIKKNREANENAEEMLKDISLEFVSRKYDFKTFNDKDRVALSMKFSFDVKDTKDDEKKK